LASLGHHVGYREAAAGLTPTLVGRPGRDADGNVAGRIVLTNVSEGIAYHPSIELVCPPEAVGGRAGVRLALVTLTEGAAGLLPGTTSEAVPFTASPHACGLGLPLLAVPHAAPTVLRRLGGFGREPGQLNKPRASAVLPDGRMLVADRGNHRLHVLEPDGSPVATWGSFGTGPGQLDHPQDVAVHATSHDVFVCDMNNDRIQVWSADGTYRRSFPRARAGPASLDHPTDLALSADGTEVYVADAAHFRIAVFDTRGRFLRSWGGRGRELAQFLGPTDVEVDAAGRVYVTDVGRLDVQVFSRGGDPLHAVDGTAGGGRGFSYPSAVLPLDGDRVLIADFNQDRIVAHALSGAFLGEFGRHGEELGALHYPSDLALHGHELVVTETASNSISIFDVSEWVPALGTTRSR
jgi:DNA-binding beta-propeller fold protein YncE